MYVRGKGLAAVILSMTNIVSPYYQKANGWNSYSSVSPAPSHKTFLQIPELPFRFVEIEHLAEAQLIGTQRLTYL